MGLEDKSSQTNDRVELQKLRERNWHTFWRTEPTEADKVFRKQYHTFAGPKWFSMAIGVVVKAIGVGALYFIAIQFSIVWALVAYVLVSGAMMGSNMWMQSHDMRMVDWNFHAITESLDKLGAYDDAPKGEKHE